MFLNGFSFNFAEFSALKKSELQWGASLFNYGVHGEITWFHGVSSDADKRAGKFLTCFFLWVFNFFWKAILTILISLHKLSSSFLVSCWVASLQSAFQKLNSWVVGNNVLQRKKKRIAYIPVKSWIALQYCAVAFISHPKLQSVRKHQKSFCHRKGLIFC